MTWEEIAEKQGNEYKEHLIGYMTSWKQLETDKEMILQQFKCKEIDLPDAMKDKLSRDKESWKREWGMYGNRFKNMRDKQQKEILNFITQQKVVQSLTKRPNDKNKEPER